MNSPSIVAPPYSRVHLGFLVIMPKAARRVYEAIHYLARRWGNEIRITDRHLIQECSEMVSRRCIQKGLNQLEALGLISRFRQHGARIITFLATFPKKLMSQASEGKPAAKAASDAPVPMQNPPLPSERPPTPEEVTKRDEMLALWRQGKFGVISQPSLSSAATSAADPDAIRAQEESRARQLAMIEARKLAHAPHGDDQAEAPNGQAPPARE